MNEYSQDKINLIHSTVGEVQYYSNLSARNIGNNNNYFKKLINNNINNDEL